MKQLIDIMAAAELFRGNASVLRRSMSVEVVKAARS
jgi:hypothetical protein